MRLSNQLVRLLRLALAFKRHLFRKRWLYGAALVVLAMLELHHFRRLRTHWQRIRAYHVKRMQSIPKARFTALLTTAQVRSLLRTAFFGVEPSCIGERSIASFWDWIENMYPCVQGQRVGDIPHFLEFRGRQRMWHIPWTLVALEQLLAMLGLTLVHARGRLPHGFYWHRHVTPSGHTIWSALRDGEAPPIVLFHGAAGCPTPFLRFFLETALCRRAAVIPLHPTWAHGLCTVASCREVQFKHMQEKPNAAADPYLLDWFDFSEEIGRILTSLGHSEIDAVAFSMGSNAVRIMQDSGAGPIVRRLINVDPLAIFPTAIYADVMLYYQSLWSMMREFHRRSAAARVKHGPTWLPLLGTASNHCRLYGSMMDVAIAIVFTIIMSSDFLRIVNSMCSDFRGSDLEGKWNSRDVLFLFGLNDSLFPFTEELQEYLDRVYPHAAK